MTTYAADAQLSNAMTPDSLIADFLMPIPRRQELRHNQ